MNDLPYFDGSSYCSLDGSPYPDYAGAVARNVQLVSNVYSGFYNPSSSLYDSSYDMSATVYENPQQVLDSGRAGKADTTGGWGWLTPLVGGVVDAASQIAATKIQTELQLGGIEAQGRLTLAQQQAAQRLAAANNKVIPAAPANNANWLLPLAIAAGLAVVLTRS